MLSEKGYFAVLFGVVFVVGYVVILPDYSGWQIIHPAQASDYPLPEENGFSSSLAYEEVEFYGFTGNRLTGYFWPAEGSQGRTVIAHHGYTGNQADMYAKGSNPYAGDFVGMLVENGYNVLTYDSRGHGLSEKAPVSIGTIEAFDVQAAADYLKSRPDVDPDRIGIIGHSMGGATAITSSFFSDDIKAAVADSAFDRLNDTALRVIHMFSPAPEWMNRQSSFAMNMYALVPTDQVAPEDYLLWTGKPVLVIQKAGDPIIPLEESQKMVEAAGDNVETWVPGGEGHTSAINDDRELYEQKVVGFFDAHL